MSTNFKDKVFKDLFDQLCEDYLQDHPDMDMEDGVCLSREGVWYRGHINVHCSTLQHTVTHLQHTCSTLQHIATHGGGGVVEGALICTAAHYNTLQDKATHCNTLQHNATHCNALCYAL